MNKLYMNRKHPLSKIVSVLVLFLLLAEAFVIFGGFGIDARTVYKTAPWLHPYYLKLVGEDPDSIREWNRFFEERNKKKKKVETPETPSVSTKKDEAKDDKKKTPLKDEKEPVG